MILKTLQHRWYYVPDIALCHPVISESTSGVKSSLSPQLCHSACSPAPINLTGPLCMVSAVSRCRSRMARYEQWVPLTTGDLVDKSRFWRNACSYRQCELRHTWRRLQLHDGSWSQHCTAQSICMARYWEKMTCNELLNHYSNACTVHVAFFFLCVLILSWHCGPWTRWEKVTFEEDGFFGLRPWRLCMKYNVAKHTGRWFDVLFWSLAFSSRREAGKRGWKEKREGKKDT